MYPQRVISAYYQWKKGIISEEAFQRLFFQIMRRVLSRSDLSMLESEVVNRGLRFQRLGRE